jgi:hypothetical protein
VRTNFAGIKYWLLLLLIWSGLCFAIDVAFAQNWTQTTTLTNVAQNSFRGESLTSVASSADGNKLVAVVYYPVDPQNPPYSPVYISINSGTTWVPYFPWSILPNWFWWNYVTSSTDGTKLAVASQNGGQIYTSTNSGIDWMQTSAPDYGWSSMASSADGNILVAVAWNGPICVSTNSGATWATTADPWFWTSVATSADGSIMVATSVARTNAIYVSNGLRNIMDSNCCAPVVLEFRRLFVRWN